MSCLTACFLTFLGALSAIRTPASGASFSNLPSGCAPVRRVSFTRKASAMFFRPDRSAASRDLRQALTLAQSQSSTNSVSQIAQQRTLRQLAFLQSCLIIQRLLLDEPSRLPAVFISAHQEL